MTMQLEGPVASAQPAVELRESDDFDLDVTIAEGGPAADQLIRLTNDGCNSTCATACVSCP
ncbi:FxLD family lanthipeptide [Streptomyces albus]|uniref:FxLD family lanthipeptide n=1 Tax=Streptomyces albus TaxID=1888 RepID=UPI0004C57BC7|nr:FxLD family lanthipeptide [Streptomyces albus]